MNTFDFVITLIFIFVISFVFSATSVGTIKDHITTVVNDQFYDFKSDIKEEITDLILKYIKTESKAIQFEDIRSENEALRKQVQADRKYIRLMGGHKK